MTSAIGSILRSAANLIDPEENQAPVNNPIQAREIPRPLTDEQRKEMEKMIDTSKSIQEYLKEHPMNGMELLQEYAPRTLILSSVGGGAAYGVSIMLGLSSPVTTTAIGIGIFGGAALGIKTSKDKIESNVFASLDFERWKTSAIKDNVYDQYQDFIKEDDRLAELLCPLTLDLINYPMKAPDTTPTGHPDGTVFEGRCIAAYLRNCTLMGIINNRTHPLRIQPLTLESLTFDHSYHKKVYDKLNEILNESILDVVREGLEAFRNSIEAPCLITLHELENDLFQKLQNEEITHDQYMAAKNRLNNIFNRGNNG
ncbi:MAG: hypothetical protein COT84_08805 [Chlamydiae bacterium CG10_big_fil_rev_8_21_14_0_10_35_9]|nr:MAG: hypothetical protein COT84_08805 [Chlamydiae bacterium CG10_big_fil_rev_8_21_14_0_10_35_9]